MAPDALISEVGPRDRLRTAARSMPTAVRAPLMAGLPGEPLYGVTSEAALPKHLEQPQRAAHG